MRILSVKTLFGSTWLALRIRLNKDDTYWGNNEEVKSRSNKHPKSDNLLDEYVYDEDQQRKKDLRQHLLSDEPISSMDYNSKPVVLADSTMRESRIDMSRETTAPLRDFEDRTPFRAGTSTFRKDHNLKR